MRSKATVAAAGSIEMNIAQRIARSLHRFDQNDGNKNNSRSEKK
jgi:hypothetical protein